MIEQKSIIIGIDISNKTLDIFDNFLGKSVKITNSETNISSYFKECINSLEPDIQLLVFFEPTGNYGQKLLKYLNTNNISYFQIGLDIISKLSHVLWDRNKNDKLDAQKIALCWSFLYSQNYELSWVKSRLISPISNELLRAKNLLQAKRSLTNFIMLYKQYCHNISLQPFEESKELKKFYQKQIQSHEKEISILDEHLELLLKELGFTEHKLNLESIPGIGKTTSISLIFFFLELQQKWLKKRDWKKVRASVWIDPQNKQSWTSLNRCMISKRGNKHIRTVLFFSAMALFRHMNNIKYVNTTIWIFAQRMKTKFTQTTSRWSKSILLAIEWKILTTAWAIFNDNAPYVFR